MRENSAAVGLTGENLPNGLTLPLMITRFGIESWDDDTLKC